MSVATAAQLLDGAQDLVSIRLRSIPELGVGISIIDLPGTDLYGYPALFWRVDSDKIWTGSFYVGELEDSGENSSRPDLDASLPAALLAAGFSGAIESMCGNGECFSPEGDVETAALILRGLGYQVTALDQNGRPFGDTTAVEYPRWTRADWDEVYEADSGSLPEGSENYRVSETPQFELRPSDDGSGTIVQIFQGCVVVDEEEGFISYSEKISWRAREEGSAASERCTAWAGEFFGNADGVHPFSDDLAAALEFVGLHPTAMVSSRREAYSPNPDLLDIAAELRGLGYRVTISEAFTRSSDFE